MFKVQNGMFKVQLQGRTVEVALFANSTQMTQIIRIYADNICR